MSDYRITPEVISEITAERTRQIQLYGRYKDMPPETWLMVDKSTARFAGRSTTPPTRERRKTQ